MHGLQQCNGLITLNSAVRHMFASLKAVSQSLTFLAAKLTFLHILLKVVHNIAYSCAYISV